jgi:hypothetical protein
MIIKKPVFGTGNPRNDYGLGFYCTREIELAKEWACTDENSGFVNCYELDIDGLSVLHLSGAGYNILNWIAILLNNRSFRISNDVAADGKLYFPKRNARDEQARAALRKERESQRVAESVYLMDILREGWENDDTRLRRNIY